ncbi:MAG: S1 family peptidase [Stackebrandtia sp.]
MHFSNYRPSETEAPSRGPGILRRAGVVSSVVVAAAVAFAASAAGASAEPADADVSSPDVAAVDFAGTVALSNCSGSVVRMPNSADDDPAFVMTNAHCLEAGMPAPGEVIVDEPSDRSFSLLDAEANEVATLTASKIAYATMTDTDIALYELTSTYADISSEHGVDALPLRAEKAAEGTAITVVSGYWKETYSCSIDGFVYELHEADWVWKDSLRYTTECKTIGGTSGSPVLDDATGEVVGVNNTGNESGEECTMNNPCEVDENGNVEVRQGTNYGQQSYLATACVDEGNQINLELPDCALPKP